MAYHRTKHRFRCNNTYFISVGRGLITISSVSKLYLSPASGVLLFILYHRILLGLGGVLGTEIKLTLSNDFTETLIQTVKVNVSSQEDEPLLIKAIVLRFDRSLNCYRQINCSERINNLVNRLLEHEYMAVVKDFSLMSPKELKILKTFGG